MFLTDAVVPAANMVGAPGDGWRVLQTALGYERRLMGDLARTSRGARKPAEQEDPLIALAREYGKISDGHTRQQIARIHELNAVNKWNTQRAKGSGRVEAATLLSFGKLSMSRISSCSSV